MVLHRSNRSGPGSSVIAVYEYIIAQLGIDATQNKDQFVICVRLSILNLYLKCVAIIQGMTDNNTVSRINLIPRLGVQGQDKEMNQHREIKTTLNPLEKREFYYQNLPYRVCIGHPIEKEKIVCELVFGNNTKKLIPNGAPITIPALPVNND